VAAPIVAIAQIGSSASVKLASNFSGASTVLQRFLGVALIGIGSYQGAVVLFGDPSLNGAMFMQ